jgi:acyl dehydratase
MRVGDTARRTRTVTMRDIELFTELTGDRNPLHYDEEIAAATRFGGVIVQGGVTSGLLNAVVAEDLPGPGTVFLHTDWRFLAPVKPGDQITAEVEVIGLREDKPVATLRTTITDQDGRIVLDGKAVTWSEPLQRAAESPNQAKRSRDGGLPAHDARGDHSERPGRQRPLVQGTSG